MEPRGCQGGNEAVVRCSAEYFDILETWGLQLTGGIAGEGRAKRKLRQCNAKRKKRDCALGRRSGDGWLQSIGASLPFICRLFLNNAGRFFPIDAAIVDSHL